MITLDGGFPHTRRVLRRMLLEAPDVSVGEVHAQNIKGVSQLVTKELQNVSLSMTIPGTPGELAKVIKPNLPWAEDHFSERVCGNPLNPPPSAARWPFAQKGHAEHTDEHGQFSHTYPERFWPRFAGNRLDPIEDAQRGNYGIRYRYGDLTDVVDLLDRSPLTRQAYLPVWFPEDTGSVDSQRVPCTLGYHFIVRYNPDRDCRELNVTYMIRSCDFVRFFQDDVYMACRLAQWVVEQLVEKEEVRWEEETGEHRDSFPVPETLPEVGSLTMHITSLHIFHGDIKKLESEVS